MKKFFRLGTTAKVSMVILISRMTGFVRDICIATFIGAGPLNDAFLAAFKLANLFRAIFSEGAMNSAIVPTISHSLASHGDKYTRLVKCHILTMLVTTLILFTLFVFYYMEFVILITNYGFANNPTIFNLAVDLAYIIFPYLSFISISAFYGSILQVKGIFIPFAATSIIMNSVLISSFYICISLGDFCTSQVHALSYSVLISGILEMLWMISWAYKYNVKLQLRKPILSKYSKKILKRFLPAIFSSGMVQISVWCDMIILSCFSGGISYLYFADRIIQLPLALFSTASAMTLLPLLSKVSADQAMKSAAFNKSLRTILCFILPAAIGLFLISDEIITAFFRRGKFTNEAAINTALMLKILCFALPFQGICKIYNAVLYSTGNTKTPMYISIVNLVINISISFALKDYVGYICVAIAAIFSNATQLLLLILSSKEIAKISAETKKDFLKYIIGMVVMGFAIVVMKEMLVQKSNSIKIISLIFCGGISYIVILATLKVKILKDFFSRS
jgi:putative peptidoglycan lipid II flippase